MRLLHAVLVLLVLSAPLAFPSRSTNNEELSMSSSYMHQVVNVILVGATGDLAAKYLWVALFRLALEASTTGRTFRFFAGASDTLAWGRTWHKKFFNEIFAQRVCGALNQHQQQLSIAQRECREFLRDEFIPSVEYTPLREENHYRELGERMDAMKELLPTDKREEGRMVYLAIPPQFFLQSCQRIHRYLRPRSSELGTGSFLRIVVEKPFGHDVKSARELATQLRAIYHKDELYVMDHYAGKLVVHALRSYFQLNGATLHPVWDSNHIESIHIDLAEIATLKNRVHYFDSTGIIRDVMVNHLQLILGVAVIPSFDTTIFSTAAPPDDLTRRLHDAQLRFVQGLQVPPQYQSTLVAQYEEYATHYEDEMEHGLDTSDHFTPTAAMIEFTSSLDEWRNTTFRLAAAKATDRRLLALTITFKDGVFTMGSQCSFIVTIQQTLNADTRQSHRIEWSCDVSEVLGNLKVPDGWEYRHSDDHRVMTPTQVGQNMKESSKNAEAWELGDELSAYDILLKEVSNGASEHFADLDEVEAAWALWTPVVQAAEQSESGVVIQATSLQYVTYPAGTSPWKQILSHWHSPVRTQTAREEL